MKNNRKLFVYAKANQMEEHKFTDDVALCYADSKGQALEIFLRLYGNATINDIKEPYFNDHGIAILTDY